ncbi:photosynthetic complex assembly protein PuhC [Methylobacterium trifolii]|uniref:Photosynthetic complex assembly protein n=1 Tax=Methylobacterium trifolii TaxID=1003092 RepID=A0ABQ4TXK9_9HYPH|nr:photosynthetic complex assembly protein PuhC [Methylobacterium trifolii]GJE59999.1 hypothetical protein MPOCJGCO_2108 [Methylobacterium trifolii]
MREATEGGPIPAMALIGSGALMGFTMLAVMIGRGEGVGLTALPPARSVAQLDFRAEDQADGSIALRDAADRHLVALVRPGEDGFIRGTLRGLAQARQRAGKGPETPFRLTRLDDGRLSLSDAATGREVALEAFGDTNARSFARLLPEPGRPATETR